MAVPVPLARTFTYRPPPDWKGPLPPVGSRVVVPLGSRISTGFVVGHPTSAPPGVRLASARGVVDSSPVFPPAMLDLCRRVADYYLAGWGEVLQAAAPPAVRVRTRTRVILQSEGTTPTPERLELFPPERPSVPRSGVGPRQRRILEALANAGGSMTRTALERRLGRALHQPLRALAARGMVRIETETVRPSGGPRPIQLLRRIESDAVRTARLGPKGKRLLTLLAERGGWVPVAELREAGFAESTIQSLIRWGCAERVFRRPVPPDPVAGVAPRSVTHLAPTAAQARAIHAIRARLNDSEGRDTRPILLHGVTGSGKTLVYVEAIRAALDAGRTALVLVPEIGLTVQLVADLTHAFPDQVALLHSALGAAERALAWNEVARGKRRIVVGARSAVFAPLPSLGLLVIDEEHDASFKQEGGVPYDARWVARERARSEGALLVVGSATPSLETYAASESGRIVRLELPERIDDRPLPSVVRVDLRRELRRGNRGALSQVLREKIADRMERGEQVVLLLNRRGFAPRVICRACGHVPGCPDCAVILVYHRDGERLRCHYCGHERPIPEKCEACGSGRRHLRGRGTQRLEEELAQHFPRARILRMDQDATRRRSGIRDTLAAFARGDADVLLGTQMVAKGLDVAGVTLVGVISADIGLSVPDFRAGERTFALLTQVAGRAGRGSRPGEVVIQTHHPDHDAIVLACKHDYRGFYAREMEIRRALRYPPFCHLVSVECRSSRSEEAVQSSSRLAACLREEAPSCTVLGPAPAPVSRVRREHRSQILLKTGDLEATRREIRRALDRLSLAAAVVIDVDPVRFL